MAFLGAAAILFLLVSKAAKGFKLSARAEGICAIVLLGFVVAAFGLIFGFDGIVIPDWADRARR